MTRNLLLAGLAAAACAVASFPTARSAPRLPDEERVRQDRYFTGLDLQRHEAEGFVFLVQGTVADPGALVATYGAWLDEAWRELRVEWLEKAGVLERGGDRPRVIVVLDSARTFQGYRVSHPAVPDVGRGAVHDPNLGAVVHYHDPADPNRAAWRDRSDLMRAVVHLLLAEHTADGVVEPASPWLMHGLAEWVGTSRADDPARFGGHEADPALLGELAARGADEAGRAAWWIDLETLLQPRNEQDLATLAARWFSSGGRTLPEGTTDAERDRAFDACYRAQARLWLRFLLEGRGGKYGYRLPKLVDYALEGELGTSQLRATLAERDLRGLEADYRSWVTGILSGVTPATTASASGGPSLGTAGENTGLLAVTNPSDEQRLGRALWVARRGRLQAALEHLGESSGPGEDPRMGRARMRLTELIAGRDAWLEALGTGELDLWVPIEGKLKKVGVQRVRDGAVRFERPYSGIASWEVDDLDASILAANLGKAKEAFGPDWLRPFGMLLAGEDRWERYLRGDDPDSEALREDAEGFPTLLATGEVLELLEVLSAGTPDGPAAGAANRAAIERVLALAPGVPLVESRRHALREAARAALAAELSAAPWSDFLAGEVTELDGGRIRVAYEFDDPEELTDFLVDRDVFAFRLLENKTEVAPEDAHVSVSGGRAHFLGRIGILHQLQMEGPVSGTFTWLFDKQMDTSTKQLPSVHCGILADRDRKARLAALDFSGGEVMGNDNPLYFWPEAPPGLFPDRPYACEVAYDGASVMTVSVNGEKAFDLAARNAEPGVAFLSSQSAYENHLDALVVEGKPTETARAALLRGATERALKRMGL